jgi:hypothetical protein
MNYLLRNIPEPIWSQVKVAASSLGLSVRAWLLFIIIEHFKSNTKED